MKKEKREKEMRKLSTIFTCAFLILILCSCNLFTGSKTDPDDNPLDPPAVEQVKVDYFYDEKIQTSIKVDLQTILDRPEDPVKVDYRFVDWYEDYYFTNVFDFSKPVISNVTIYGRFEILSYQVSFDTNGGSEMEPQTLQIHTTLEEPTPPTKSDYTFAGWYTDEQCTTAYDFNTQITSNFTLYAKWNEVAKTYFNVEFNSNGGSTVPTSVVLKDGLVLEPTAPVRTGYTFAGWYQESTCQNVWNFTANTVTKNLTLFAKWEVNKVTVSFDTNGGTSLTAQSITYGSIPTLGTTSKTGYTFKGWYTNQALTSAYTNTPIIQNTTLYAKWEIQSFTVSFNSNGGSTVPNQTVSYGFVPTLSTPTKENYLFKGWYTNQALSAAYNNDPILQNTTLYAKWQEKNTDDTTLDAVSGFASGYVNDRSNQTITNVTNESEFLRALKDQKKAINITRDLDLGYTSLQEKSLTSTYSGFVKKANAPKIHPTLLETGVSKISLKTAGTTIFSENGAKILHACFTISANDIIIRNLEFDELWEWDESLGSGSGDEVGGYDVNDWDYITVQGASGVWINQCTFHKAYDGLIDMKPNGSTASKNLTISNCNFLSGSYTEGDFFWTQMNYLETEYQKLASNSDGTKVYGHKIDLYTYLRNDGMSFEDICTYACCQKKGHLVGSSEFATGNSSLSITIMNCYYTGLMDRLPRLRGGNAHLLNVVDDASSVIKAKTAIAKLAHGTDLSNVTNLNNLGSNVGASLGYVNQAVVTTEGGAVLAENCIFIGTSVLIKNNQKSASKPEYTGKYKFQNCEYQACNQNGEVTSTTLLNTDGTLENTPSIAIGNATCIAFSFTGMTALPYTYETIARDTLSTTLQAKVGAGTIAVTTIKDWLKI